MVDYNNQKLYIETINHIQDYIEKHIHENLTVEKLAEVVYISQFYFLRLFRLVTGESLYQYIKRNRLEKSIFLLRSDKNRSITEIALDIGFSNQASFAKAFKKAYGISASSFRKIGNEDIEDRLKISSKERIKKCCLEYEKRLNRMMIPKEVNVKRLEAKELVYIRYTGSYKGDKELFEKLFEKLYLWANERSLIKDISNWVVIYHDQSDFTEDEKLRISVCLEVDKLVNTEGEIGFYHLDSGNYVVGVFEVDESEYQYAWDYMLFEWIPKSKYKVSDRLSFEAYSSDKKADSKNKQVVQICIPIEQKE